jgi:alkylation response protein AidB-like acyl-CoA dehydrogenase
MSLDLDFDDGQQAVAEAVSAFCSDRCPEPRFESEDRFPRELWKELAELGVLAIGTPAGEGGALEQVAAFESLGRAVFPGPLAASVFAVQLLDGDARRDVAAGVALVSVGEPPLFPFAPEADLLIETDGAQAWLGRLEGEVAPVGTLGGENWGRGAWTRERDLGDARDALAVHHAMLAAWLAAAGERIVQDAAEHARVRRQFGRAIGEFQAVAHPLADSAMALASARTLARRAAWRIDRDGREAARRAGALAWLSARRAATDAAHVAHQVFGAMGITTQGPAFHISRRILQSAAQPPAGRHERDAVLGGLPLEETVA